MNRYRTARIGGWTAVAAGIVGAAAGVMLLVVPAQVPADEFGYPFSHAGFTAVQSAFFVHHLAMAFALAAFWRAGLAGNGRFASVSAWSSVTVMGLLSAQELVAITGAGAPYPSGPTDVIEGVYGVISLLLGVALVLYGIATARARVLDGAGRWSLLIVGVYVFVPMTPALFAGFVAGRVVLTVWLLLFAWWGWLTVRWADAAQRTLPARARAVSSP